VCLVTGASSGIGRRTALELARAGARICVAARREERLKELVEELPGDGHSYMITDVSSSDDWTALRGHVEETYGRLDVLINNAGVGGERGSFKGAGSLDNLRAVMDTNFFGAIYGVAEFLPLLERSAPSNIVNVTSVAGRLATPGASAYVASKFALVGWTESIEAELAPKGIYVSSVEPGFIPTEGFPQSDMVDHPVLSRILGTEEDVAKAIMHAIEHRKAQRVVPRWYYLLQVPRLVAPRVFRAVRGKIAGRMPTRAGKSR
jgi:NAD(P)-dependent dehydrogenase (short-subunit alcohol dehydrogenase family)